MKALAAALLGAFAALTALLPLAADEGDRVVVLRNSALIGEQFEVLIEVHTAPGATVELNPGTPSWAGVEVVRAEPARTRQEGEFTVHSIELLVAAFLPGELQFTPAVTVVSGAEAVPRALPETPLTVLATLGPNDPLELSPLAGPVAIDGAESPLLRPAIAIGALAGAALVALLLWFAGRALWRRLRPTRVPEVGAEPVPSLALAEHLLHTDPVGAYRVLSSVVKGELARRYGLPAPALTTGELRRRMEDQGLDRWQARLVGGLLEECDAVIYAGYRPAAERRNADVTMAREIIEAPA